MNTKKKSISMIILSFFMVVSAFLGITSLSKSSVEIMAESATSVELVKIDTATRGFWYYANDTAGYGDKDHRENRIYGQEGCMICYMADNRQGRPAEVIEIVDYTNNSKINYVDLPSYITINSNVDSQGEATPFRYYAEWGYDTFAKFAEEIVGQLPKKDLRDCMIAVNPKTLADDPERGQSKYKYVTTQNGQGAVVPLDYTVRMSDDKVHLVTIASGNGWAKAEGNVGNWTTHQILDLNENVLFSIEMDGKPAPWIQFAIKGDFIYRTFCEDQSEANVRGIFFDEFKENDEIGKKNLAVSLRAGTPTTVDLVWEEDGTPSSTYIWRREAGSNANFEVVGYAPAGTQTFTDTNTLVAKQYEYALQAAVRTDYPEYRFGNTSFFNELLYKDMTNPDGSKTQFRIDCNLLDKDMTAVVKTAPYRTTRIVTDQRSYNLAYNQELKMQIKLERATKKLEDLTPGEELVFEPYPNAVIKVTLGGETAIASNGVPNMKTDLNDTEIKTDIDGYLYNDDSDKLFHYYQEFAGEYTINFSVESLSITPDAMEGYDSCSLVVNLNKEDPPREAAVPYLLDIAEAIKPGDTMYIFGANIEENSQFKIAYALNDGDDAGEFNENTPPSGVKYLTRDDMLTFDAGKTGVMFTLPIDTPAGVYDFWIKNSVGWGKGITLNAAKPLNLGQEGVYAGIAVDIVGRNYAGYEFGVGTEATWRDSVKVKIVKLDADGRETSESYTYGIIDKIRYAATDDSYDFTFNNVTGQPATEAFKRAIQNKVSVTGKEVNYSEMYKISFTVDERATAGFYNVYVANDGRYFVKVDSADQTLEVTEKKAQDWDETVFGAKAGNTHIGNDPLDLGVYWAQDLVYTNIRTMEPNALATQTALKNAVIQAVADLAKAGGGVVYFPEGEYYLPKIAFKDDYKGGDIPYNWTDKVIFVGAGADKTFLHYVGTGGSSWLRYCGDYMGYYGLTFDKSKYATGIPDAILNGADKRSDDPDAFFSEGDSETKQNKNFFVSDCISDFPLDPKSDQRGIFLIFGIQKNMLVQNNLFLGGTNSIYTYTFRYLTIRNCFDRAGIMAATTYGVYENVYQDNGHEINSESHGMSGKTTYMGNIYETRTGNGANSTNVGEIVLIEPAGKGYSSTGKVLAATERTVTLAMDGGLAIYEIGDGVHDSTGFRYGYASIFISDGTGMGQLRHVKKVPTEEKGNTYELYDWEEDWDIIPDSTSKYTVINPLENNTIYRLNAVECQATICMYSTMVNTLVAECNLVDTGGISLWATNVNGGRCCPMYNSRVENNVIIGRGSAKAQGEEGGINVYVSGTAGYRGCVMMGVTIKNNYVASNSNPFVGVTAKEGEYTPDTLSNYSKNAQFCTHEGICNGIVIQCADVKEPNNNGYLRFVAIEGNTVENTQNGIKADNAITGIVARNNVINNVVNEKEVDIGIYAAGAVVKVTYTLYTKDASGNYVLLSSNEYNPNPKSEIKLPTLDEDGFVGWSESKNYKSGDKLYTKVENGYSSRILYAAYATEQPEEESKGGCGSDITGSIIVLSSAIALAYVFMVARKNKAN